MGLKEICLPDLGEGVTEGEIIKVACSPGDTISMDQVILEVMTDKASMEVPSSVEGVVEEVKVKPGDMVSVGEVVIVLKTKGKESAPQKKISSPSQKTKKSPPQKQIQKSSQESLAIPSTRKLAQEFDVSLQDVSTSNNHVSREDLIQHIKSNSSVRSHSFQPLEIEGGELKREPLIGIKRLMFESMTLSKAKIPHFTVGEAANAQHIVNVRNKINQNLKSKNIRLTYLPFFMKALLAGLKDFPIFNSSYDERTKELVYKKSCHLGFAVDTPQGLIVPVVKNAEFKSLLDIAQEITTLSEQARQGTIDRNNLKHASITLTNLGSLGGLYGTPIINHPEVAILGIYRMHSQVIKTDTGEFEEQPFIHFSLTCDHRFIDGATATRFLKNFVSQIEEPSLLTLN